MGRKIKNDVALNVGGETMKARGIVLMVVAIVLAGLASFFVRTWKSGSEQTVAEHPYPERIAVPVAVLAGPENKQLRSASGGLGMVLLKRGEPSNQIACEVFFNTFDLVYDFGVDELEVELPSGERVIRRPTFWLVTKQDVVADESYRGSEFCENRWLANYDFTRALYYLGVAESRSGHSFRDFDGPFFVAFPDDPRRPVMALDLSKVPEEGYHELITAWQSKIIHDPDLWEPDALSRKTFAAEITGYLNRATAGATSVADVLVGFLK